MSNENTTGTTTEATSKVSPDMPHVETHTEARAETQAGASTEIPHDREPGEIHKENNTAKYLKAAFIVLLAVLIIIAGFLLGKRLFSRETFVMADEVVSNFSAVGVTDWFKKLGSSIAAGASKAIGFLKGLFSRNTVATAADAATAAV